MKFVRSECVHTIGKLWRHFTWVSMDICLSACSGAAASAVLRTRCGHVSWIGFLPSVQASRKYQAEWSGSLDVLDTCLVARHSRRGQGRRRKENPAKLGFHRTLRRGAVTAIPINVQTFNLRQRAPILAPPNYRRRSRAVQHRPARRRAAAFQPPRLELRRCRRCLAVAGRG